MLCIGSYGVAEVPSLGPSCGVCMFFSFFLPQPKHMIGVSKNARQTRCEQMGLLVSILYVDAVRDWQYVLGMPYEYYVHETNIDPIIKNQQRAIRIKLATVNLLIHYL